MCVYLIFFHTTNTNNKQHRDDNNVNCIRYHEIAISIRLNENHFMLRNKRFQLQIVYLN